LGRSVTAGRGLKGCRPLNPTDDGRAAQALSVPIAAALVSMKRHMKTRRLPNFVDKSFVSFPNWKAMTHAHRYRSTI
jgi:hypothetical protein